MQTFFLYRKVTKHKSRRRGSRKFRRRSLSLFIEVQVCRQSPGVRERRGQHGLAVSSFREALSIRPNHARCLFRLGNSLFALEHFKEAEQAYRSALEVSLVKATFCCFREILWTLVIGLALRFLGRTIKYCPLPWTLACSEEVV
jgi:tetratricopeptide (TPR) repeat protein